MSLFKPLFLRYLLRQRLFAAVASCSVCAIINFVFFFTSTQQSQTFYLLFVVVAVIWGFPIYLLIITFSTYLSFKREVYNITLERDLFIKVTNKMVREMVVKNGIGVNIFSDKKTDFVRFKKVLNNELKFHRKNIELLREK